MQSLFFGSLFILSLFFLSLDKRLFSFHCIVWVPAFFQLQCRITNDKPRKFRKHWTSTVHLEVLVSAVSLLNGVWLFIYGKKWDVMNSLIWNVVPSPLGCLAGSPKPTLSVWLCSALSLVGEIWSILSISADIETVGEILLKIIPTLEEVRTCWTYFLSSWESNWTQWTKHLRLITKWSKCPLCCRHAF